MNEHKRKDGALPRSVDKLIADLEEAGEDEVKSLSVIRKPVQGYACILMDALSMKKFKKVVTGQPGFDKMFHLSLCVNGKWRLEKNEVIALTEMDKANDTKCRGTIEYFRRRNYMKEREIERIVPSPSGVEFMRVALPTDRTFTIRSLLDNAREFMGPEKFSEFSARYNNCQNFAMGVLEGNGLLTDHLTSFIRQDTDAIFEELPPIATCASRGITDIAAVADNLQEKIRPSVVKENLEKKLSEKLTEGIESDT